MESRIEKLGPKHLIGMQMEMSLVDDRTRELWSSFMPRQREILNRASDENISMQVYDGEAEELFSPVNVFTKWAAVEVSPNSEPPEGMESYFLEGGLYAVFIHNGPASAFGKTLRFIFVDWLPGSGYEPDRREHFEILPAGYDPEDPSAREEIWIPVRPRL